MKAFTNTVETKAEAVSSARRHRKLDMLVKGTYSQGSGASFKGCSVGCTYQPFRGKVQADNLHALSEPVHGIPQSLTRIRDTVFEWLPEDAAKDWHVNFTIAIHVGADLSMVTSKLMYWLMTDKSGIRKHAKKSTLKIIDKIAELYKQRINGSEPQRSVWLSILEDARTERDAAYAAAAAAYAADAAYAAARRKYYKKIAAKVISLLKETK